MHPSFQSQLKIPLAAVSEEMLKSSRCIGADMLMKLLGSYCQNKGIRTAIRVGVVGKSYIHIHTSHDFLKVHCFFYKLTYAFSEITDNAITFSTVIVCPFKCLLLHSVAQLV